MVAFEPANRETLQRDLLAEKFRDRSRGFVDFKMSGDLLPDS